MQVTKNNPETEYSWVKNFYSQDTFYLIREDKLFIELMEKLNSHVIRSNSKGTEPFFILWSEV